MFNPEEAVGVGGGAEAQPASEDEGMSGEAGDEPADPRVLASSTVKLNDPDFVSWPCPRLYLRITAAGSGYPRSSGSLPVHLTLEPLYLGVLPATATQAIALIVCAAGLGHFFLRGYIASLLQSTKVKTG